MITYFQTREEINKLREQNIMLLEELEAAPPLPMKSNIDFWYGIYDTWRDEALAMCAVCREGLDDIS